MGFINNYDYIGKKFNKLTIIEDTSLRAKNGGKYVKCLCECGNTKIIRLDSVKAGKQKSCGCLLTGNESLKYYRRKGNYNMPRHCNHGALYTNIVYRPDRHSYQVKMTKDRKTYTKSFKDLFSAIEFRNQLELQLWGYNL